jgi:hypothetical protein
MLSSLGENMISMMNSSMDPISSSIKENNRKI